MSEIPGVVASRQLCSAADRKRLIIDEARNVPSETIKEMHQRVSAAMLAGENGLGVAAPMPSYNTFWRWVTADVDGSREDGSECSDHDRGARDAAMDRSDQRTTKPAVTLSDTEVVAPLGRQNGLGEDGTAWTGASNTIASLSARIRDIERQLLAAMAVFASANADYRSIRHLDAGILKRIKRALHPRSGNRRVAVLRKTLRDCEVHLNGIQCQYRAITHQELLVPEPGTALACAPAHERAPSSQATANEGARSTVWLSKQSEVRRGLTLDQGLQHENAPNAQGAHPEAMSNPASSFFPGTADRNGHYIAKRRPHFDTSFDERDPGASRPQWGAELQGVPQLRFGEAIGRQHLSTTEHRAMLRERLITPVLRGRLTPATVAHVVEGVRTRDRAAIERLPVEAQFLERMLTETDRGLLRTKKRGLHSRTIERWVAAAEIAIRIGKASGDTPLWHALRHEYPKRRNGARRTSSVLEQLVRDVFLHQDHRDWSAAVTWRHVNFVLGESISRRQVELIIGRIPDRERIQARGGPAGYDEALRIYLPHGAEYPNHVWIMDHSWLRHEVELLEYRDVVTDDEYEIEYDIEEEDGYGNVIPRRQRGLWLTSILDLFTRRQLTIRLWASQPDTRATLTVLAHAVRIWGLPEVLYTDNGGDFVSGDTAEALDRAGIVHRLTAPYTPQGRGAKERSYSTIKNGILPLLPGYYGGRSGQTMSGPRLTRAALQDRLWAGIDLFINHQKHEGTGRIPAEHYDEAVGATAFGLETRRGATPLAWLPLLLCDVRKRSKAGVECDGRLYYSPRLRRIAVGSDVHVFRDPMQPALAHLAVLGSDKNLQYVGPAGDVKCLGGAPEFAEQLRLEAATERGLEAAADADAAHERFRAMSAEAKSAGRALAPVVARMVAEDVRARIATEENMQPPPRTNRAEPEDAETLSAEDEEAGLITPLAETASATGHLAQEEEPVPGGANDSRSAEWHQRMPVVESTGMEERALPGSPVSAIARDAPALAPPALPTELVTRARRSSRTDDRVVINPLEHLL